MRTPEVTVEGFISQVRVDELVAPWPLATGVYALGGVGGVLGGWNGAVVGVDVDGEGDVVGAGAFRAGEGGWCW